MNVFLISKVRRLTSEFREIESGEEKIKDGEGRIQAMQIVDAVTLILIKFETLFRV